MQQHKLCAAVLSGLLLGLGGAWLPSGTLPALGPAVVSASQVITVDRSLWTPGAYPSLKTALAKAHELGGAVTIHVLPGTYREKVVIDQPNLTLKGDAANQTTIVWNDAEGTPLRPGDTNAGKKEYGMECATVKVTSNARNFQASNITFANDFPTEARRADKKLKSVQAFALTSEADRSAFYGCRFLGRQDTLYANAGTQYYRNCYIEGDVDFIFGQATAVFEGCEIRALNRAVKQDGKAHSLGYLTAPSTLATDKGYLFYKCHITSDISAPHYGMLGRPWHPSSEKREVNSAATFRECQLDIPLKGKAWNSMKNKFGVFQPEDNRLYEYKNKGKGALKKGEQKTNRRQLTDAEAVNYTPAAFLGKWQPKQRG